MVFGCCHKKEPHSSGILLCRVVVFRYKKISLINLTGIVNFQRFSLTVSVQVQSVVYCSFLTAGQGNSGGHTTQPAIQRKNTFPPSVSCYAFRHQLSGSVTIIGDFFSQFCVGENNGGSQVRLRKQNLLDSAWAAKLFTRLTELSRSDVRETCASSHHFSLAQKNPQKITELRDTATLGLRFR